MDTKTNRLRSSLIVMIVIQIGIIVLAAAAIVVEELAPGILPWQMPRWLNFILPLGISVLLIVPLELGKFRTVLKAIQDAISDGKLSKDEIVSILNKTENVLSSAGGVSSVAKSIIPVLRLILPPLIKRIASRVSKP